MTDSHLDLPDTSGTGPGRPERLLCTEEICQGKTLLPRILEDEKSRAHARLPLPQARRSGAIGSVRKSSVIDVHV